MFPVLTTKCMHRVATQPPNSSQIQVGRAVQGRQQGLTQTTVCVRPQFHRQIHARSRGATSHISHPEIKITRHDHRQWVSMDRHRSPSPGKRPQLKPRSSLAPMAVQIFLNPQGRLRHHHHGEQEAQGDSQGQLVADSQGPVQHDASGLKAR